MMGRSMKRLVIRTLAVLLFAATFLSFPKSSAAQASALQAQDAEVTFYSNGSLASALILPTTKHGAFYGAIFDGNERLAILKHEQFFTVRVPSGHHVFSASFRKKHPAKNALLRLDLGPGARYFVRVVAEYGVIVGSKPRLDEVSCQLAHREGGQDQPINAKDIAPGARSEVVALTSMPPCK